MSNFFDRIADTARRFPERPAIEWIGADGSRVTTYAALVEDSERIAVWLRGRGRHRGGRSGRDTRRQRRAVGGGLRRRSCSCGAVVVPLDTGYSSAQVRTIVADSGARVLFAGARYLDTAREAAPAGGSAAPRVVSLADAETWPGDFSRDA